MRVRENVSAITQRKLPTKCKDPSMFTIPSTIGNTQLEKAMLDLGSSINVMPYSIYVSFKLGPLNKTGVVIQLVDRSIAYPKGVVKDVLVQLMIWFSLLIFMFLRWRMVIKLLLFF